MLLLTADKAIPGDEVKLTGPCKIRIHAKSWAAKQIGAPKLLELVVNGKVIRSAPAEVDFPLEITRSEWIAARVTSENGGLAHTSPIYVELNGESFRDKEQAPAIVAKRLQTLDFIEGRLKNPNFIREYSSGEVDTLRDRIQKARAEYDLLK
jgi:hypothetical protein